MEKTTDYSIFKIVEGNRKLNNMHLAKLTANIFKRNLLQANPIIVNKKMEVIDGQHRLEVAKNNNLPVYYTVVDDANIEDVILLNVWNKPWTSQTFVESYAARGFNDYVWLNEFVKEYNVSLTTAVHLYFGSTNTWTVSTLKTGRLKTSPEQRAVAKMRADLLLDVRPFINKKGMLPSALIAAIVYMSDKGEGKRLVEALQKKAKTFVPETMTKRAIDQLESFLQ